MSFILDALRKSEQDRQRGRGPDIAPAGTAPPARSRSLWLPLVGLLAGLNLSLLALLWVTGTADAPPPAPAPAPAPQAPRSSPPARSSANAQTDSGRSLSSELEAVAPPPAATTRAAADSTVEFSPVTISRAVPAPASPAIDYPPTLTELLLDGSLRLDPLRMDLHVYSINPAERFVFINNARYREGAQLEAGPTVEQITDIGVILSYEGRDFLLTRD